MPFWKRAKRPAEVRLPGRATVVEVGGSVDQRQQSAVSVRLRLQVEPVEDGAFRPYTVTTAWTVATGLMGEVVPGAGWKVDVVEGCWEQVHPRDGRATWDRLRTPDEPKVAFV